MFSKLFLALVAASCVASNPVASLHPRMQSEEGVKSSMPIKVRFDASSVKNFAQQERDRLLHFAQKYNGKAKRQKDVPVANAIVSDFHY